MRAGELPRSLRRDVTGRGAGLPSYRAATGVIAGYVLSTWRSFPLGLIESLGWGWYVSLIFGTLYTYFVSRFSGA
jgi:hypothetical protein